jgi:hypothetical protein
MDTILMVTQRGFSFVCLSTIGTKMFLRMLQPPVSHKILEAKKPFITFFTCVPFVSLHVPLQRSFAAHFGVALGTFQQRAPFCSHMQRTPCCGLMRFLMLLEL